MACCSRGCRASCRIRRSRWTCLPHFPSRDASVAAHAALAPSLPARHQATFRIGAMPSSVPLFARSAVPRERSGYFRCFGVRAAASASGAKNMQFQDLGLAPVLLRALKAQGYTTATPIQAEAIPPVLQKRDVMASAPTGTGKTAAFALPLLQRLFPNGQAPEPRGKRPRALILTPTRELAAQVHASVRDCGKGLPLRSTTVFGGLSMRNQLKALQQGLDVLVATPGRLLDHLDQGSVDLRGVEILVLDEADRMLDMGFQPALRKLVAQLPRKRQTLLFSATFAGPIKTLAEQFLRDPVKVQVTPPNTVTATVSHRIHPVDAERKRDLLLHILAEDSRRQTLVFGRTKHGADKLVRFLEKSGLRAAAIHGNKSQNQRTRALKIGRAHV